MKKTSLWTCEEVIGMSIPNPRGIGKFEGSVEEIEAFLKALYEEGHITKEHLEDFDYDWIEK
jgi:hypothetical protein